MDKIKGTLKFKTNFFQAPNEIFDKTIITLKEIKRQTGTSKNGKAIFKVIRKCGISRSTSIKCIETLTTNNLITKKTRMNPYSDELKNYSNVYEVNMPWWCRICTS